LVNVQLGTRSTDTPAQAEKVLGNAHTD
jgi:hypothetical protein